MGCIDIYLEKRRGDSVYLVDKLVLVFFTPYVGLIMAPFFTHGEYGFSSVGSWDYSREWLWNSRTKLCCIASGSEVSERFHHRNLILGI